MAQPESRRRAPLLARERQLHGCACGPGRARWTSCRRRRSRRFLMTRRAAAVAIVCAGALLDIACSAGQPAPASRGQRGVVHIPVIPPRPPATVALDAFRSKIQHIVFIVKENRTFDTYFGTYPGAEGTTTGIVSTGERIALPHATDRMPRDIGHDWDDAERAINVGKMDRFDLVRNGNE